MRWLPAVLLGESNTIDESIPVHGFAKVADRAAMMCLLTGLRMSAGRRHDDWRAYVALREGFGYLEAGEIGRRRIYEDEIARPWVRGVQKRLPRFEGRYAKTLRMK